MQINQSIDRSIDQLIHPPQRLATPDPDRRELPSKKNLGKQDPFSHRLTYMPLPFEGEEATSEKLTVASNFGTIER